MTRELQNTRVRSIHRDLLSMANLVEKQIHESMTALKKHDVKSAHRIIDNDDEVDSIQKVLEEECIKFIATEQPVAKDLRRVFAASKIVTDLERMADHAVDICKVLNKMIRNVNVFNGDIEELWDMEVKVRAMIKTSVDAYINNDVKSAYRICTEDDKIDEYYKSLFSKMIKIIKTNEEMINDGTQMLFVIKYLERIADHVTNICEWTIFSKDGVYVDLNE